MTTKKMKPHLLLLAGAVSAAIAFSGTSCKKETECKAKVKCVDSLGVAIADADVQLYAPVKSPDGKTTYTADVKANGKSNGSGEAEFVFKLPAIYDIKATKIVGSHTLTGVGIIKLEEGKTVDKTVTLK